MAIQNGTVISTGSQEITYYDTITVGAGGTASTAFTAVGTAGSEIGFIYPLNSDGTYGEPYTQVKASPTAEGREFSYTAATKSITFSSGDSAPVENEQLVCAYTFATADNAQRIELTSDSTPSTALVSAYGIARDICTGELFPCVLEGTVQIDGNWNFDLTADGDPVVQNVSMEFVKSCTSNKLYDFTIYTEDEDTGD